MNIHTEWHTWSQQWVAHDVDSYDGAEDGDMTTGSGDSEWAAVLDLAEQYIDGRGY